MNGFGGAEKAAASCGKRLDWSGLPDGLLARMPYSEVAGLLLGQNREDQSRKTRFPGEGLRLVERQVEESWLLLDELGEIALDGRARCRNRVGGVPGSGCDRDDGFVLVGQEG